MDLEKDLATPLLSSDIDLEAERKLCVLSEWFPLVLKMRSPASVACDIVENMRLGSNWARYAEPHFLLGGERQILNRI